MQEKGVLLYAIGADTGGPELVQVGATGGFVVQLIGNNGTSGEVAEPVGAVEANADGKSALLGGLVAVSFNYGFNGTSFDRQRSQGNNADAVVPITLGVLDQAGFLYGFDGTNWDRLRSGANNADAVAALTLGVQANAGYNYGFDGTNWDRLRSGANNADAVTALAVGVQAQAAYQYGFNGATFDRVRAANIFKTITSASSGNTAVWTPTSGKKFRLMGYSISVSGTCAGLTANLIQLRDGATTPIAQHVAAVAATVTGDTQIYVDLGQGYLSSAANNVLNVNIATALTAGTVCVNAFGTEE